MDWRCKRQDERETERGRRKYNGEHICQEEEEEEKGCCWCPKIASTIPLSLPPPLLSYVAPWSVCGGSSVLTLNKGKVGEGGLWDMAKERRRGGRRGTFVFSLLSGGEGVRKRERKKLGAQHQILDLRIKKKEGDKNSTKKTWEIKRCLKCSFQMSHAKKAGGVFCFQLPACKWNLSKGALCRCPQRNTKRVFFPSYLSYKGGRGRRKEEGGRRRRSVFFAHAVNKTSLTFKFSFSYLGKWRLWLQKASLGTD